jgi:hypothetical protein
MFLVSVIPTKARLGEAGQESSLSLIFFWIKGPYEIRR